MTDQGQGQTPILGLRRIAPGVVEIIGYTGRGRALAWLVGIAVLIALTVVAFESPDFLSRQLAITGYGIAWGPETKWIAGFEACQRTASFYPGCHPDVTPWEYVLQIALPLGLGNGQVLGAVLICLALLGPWVFILFAPFRAPLRLDGHRRVCYGWKRSWLPGRGRLYIAPSGARLETRTPRRYDSLAGDRLSGPMLVSLGQADAPHKQRQFPVGVFLASGRGQTPEQLWRTANMVFGTDADAASAALPETFRLPWWQRLTLRSIPKMPESLEIEVDAWLAQGGRSLP